MKQPAIHTYSATGTGRFPFDMLRHDRCWPLHETDAGVIERTTRPREAGQPSTVLLAGLSEPNTARWKSFGWEVQQ